MRRLRSRVPTNDEPGALLSIGAIARRTRLAPSAIRYYEAAGLIPPPSRVGGKRAYDSTVFEAIALIKLAQDAGFTLADVRALLAGFDDRTPASARWRVMATKKLADVTQRIERAQRMKLLLERLVQCRCETLAECVRSKADALRRAI
jgi:MerR family redox-sensitive transcriptional activator SoxR